MLFDAPSLLPVVAAGIARRLGYPAWGAGHKAWMRDGLPHRGWPGDRPGDPVGALAGDARPECATSTACRSRACAERCIPRRPRCASTCAGASRRGWPSRRRTTDGLRLRPAARRWPASTPRARAGWGGPGGLGLRSRRPPARWANVYVADARCSPPTEASTVRHDDGQRVAGRRLDRPVIALSEPTRRARGGCGTLSPLWAEQEYQPPSTRQLDQCGRDR